MCFMCAPSSQTQSVASVETQSVASMNVFNGKSQPMCPRNLSGNSDKFANYYPFDLCAPSSQTQSVASVEASPLPGEVASVIELFGNQRVLW